MSTLQHPGNRSHQWVGRKLSLLFLHALEEAINVWENAASSDGNPIPGKFWHLSEEENTIREKLRSVDVSATGESFCVALACLVFDAIHF